MPTAATIIADALVSMSEISRGQTPAPEDYAKGLSELNDLLDSLSVERLGIYAVKPLAVQLTPGQQDYTIGPTGADFTNERPVLIQTAAIIIPTS